MGLSHIHFSCIFDPPYLDYRTHQSEGVHWITHRIFEDNDHAPKSKIRSVKLSYRNMRFIKRHCWIHRKVFVVESRNLSRLFLLNEYRCISLLFEIESESHFSSIITYILHIAYYVVHTKFQSTIVFESTLFILIYEIFIAFVFLIFLYIVLATATHTLDGIRFRYKSRGFVSSFVCHSHSAFCNVYSAALNRTRR